MQAYSGTKLRLARRAAGLKMEQAAIEVGRSYGSLMLYERGTVEPNPSLLCKFADLYGIDVADLFDTV